MAIYQVQEENQQKVLVPLTDTTPVDEVTVGNMQSVTSNAVAEAVGDKIVAVYFNEVLTSGFFGITVTPYNLDDYRVCGISVNYSSSNQNVTCFSYSFQKYNSSKTWVYVRMGTSTPNDNTRLSGYLLLVKVS